MLGLRVSGLNMIGLRVSRHCFTFTGDGTYDYRVEVKKFLSY